MALHFVPKLLFVEIGADQTMRVDARVEGAADVLVLLSWSSEVECVAGHGFC